MWWGRRFLQPGAPRPTQCPPSTQLIPPQGPAPLSSSCRSCSSSGGINSISTSGSPSIVPCCLYLSPHHALFFKEIITIFLLKKSSLTFKLALSFFPPCTFTHKHFKGLTLCKVLHWNSASLAQPLPLRSFQSIGLFGSLSLNPSPFPQTRLLFLFWNSLPNVLTSRECPDLEGVWVYVCMQSSTCLNPPWLISP